MQTVASIPCLVGSLCVTVILYGKRWRSEWRILCSDRREIPNSAEVLLVDLLGLRIKAMRTALMFAGVVTGVTRPLLQYRTISFKLLAKSVNCLFAKSPPCTKVCTKTSLSLYYTLCFCVKQYNFHLLIYSQPPVVRHFTNWCVGFQLWSILTVYDMYRIFHELQLSLARFAISILRCYNFNGIIKWYDISCATLYLRCTYP